MAPWVSILIRVIVAIAQGLNRQPALGAHPAKFARWKMRADKYQRILSILGEK